MMRTVPAALVVCLSIGGLLFPATGCEKKRPPRIAAQLAQANTVAEGPQRATELLRVARIQLKAGDTTGAHDSVDAARKQLSGRGEGAAPGLLDVARAYLGIGDRRKARETLGEMTEIANAIEDAGRKAKLLADAGALFGNVDSGLADPQQAKDLLGKATELAADVEDRFRAEALAVVTMGYVSGGMTDEAAEMVAKLEDCIDSLDEPRAKAEALAAAASVYAKTGDAGKANSLLENAASTAKGIDRPEGKAYALLAVAKANVANGDTATAKALLDEAEQAAGQVGDADAQATALATVRTAMSQLEGR